MNKEYLNYINSPTDITDEEKESLINWAKSGKSPYENGYLIYDDEGKMMDFISAERAVFDMIKEHEISQHIS